MPERPVRALYFAFAAVLIALTVACGGSPTEPEHDGDDDEHRTTSSSTSTPTPTPNPTPTPAPTPSPGGGTLTYTREVQPILASDCVTCHAPARRSAGVDLSSFAEVMRVVNPGDPNSRLVLATQPGGLMYSQFRGSAGQKSATIRSWVVDSRAAQ